MACANSDANVAHWQAIASCTLSPNCTNKRVSDDSFPEQLQQKQQNNANR